MLKRLEDTGLLYGYSEEGISFDEVDINWLNTYMYETVEPLAKVQPEPAVNLQFLYDLLNHDRFN